MQLRIDYVEAGKTESEEIAVLNIAPVNVDWNNVTPEQVKQLNNKSEQVQLPDGEVIEITAHYHAQPLSITISVKQGSETLCSVFGGEIFGLSTCTKQAATIGINVFVEKT